MWWKRLVSFVIIVILCMVGAWLYFRQQELATNIVETEKSEIQLLQDKATSTISVSSSQKYREGELIGFQSLGILEVERVEELPWQWRLQGMEGKYITASGLYQDKPFTLKIPFLSKVDWRIDDETTEWVSTKDLKLAKGNKINVTFIATPKAVDSNQMSQLTDTCAQWLDAKVCKAYLQKGFGNGRSDLETLFDSALKQGQPELSIDLSQGVIPYGITLLH